MTHRTQVPERRRTRQKVADKDFGTCVGCMHWANGCNRSRTRREADIAENKNCREGEYPERTFYIYTMGEAAS